METRPIQELIAVHSSYTRLDIVIMRIAKAT